MILLIGFDSDLHLDAAAVELRRRNSAFIRINPERLDRRNTQITIEINAGSTTASVNTYAGTFETSSITGVWCRYALEAATSHDSDDANRFGDEEFLVSLRGALAQIPAARWINDPFVEAKADNKPYQLALATACGLLIPPSIVAQQRSALERFADTYGPCVIKPLGDVPLVTMADGMTSGSFASLLDRAALAAGDWDETCPVLLQKHIDKSADVRVTVVDGQVFAAKLLQDATKARLVDFRNAIDLCTSEFALPTEVKTRLLELIHRLGLRYASCDFCLADAGMFFLEANVAGNYLWTEHEAGLPITSAIVDGLIAPQNFPRQGSHTIKGDS